MQRFEQARREYAAQDYRAAEEHFAELALSAEGGNGPLVLESLKYLGVSRLFLGEEARAEDAFHRLLELDAAYVMDPATFPGEVIQHFEAVRSRFLETRRLAREAEAKKNAEAQRLEAEAARRAQVRDEALRKLARQETIEVRRSRWIAALPFGVGQFQNGNDRLGLTLLVAESLLTAMSLTSFLLHQSLRNESPGDNSRRAANRAERAYRITNWVSTGLLVTTMVAGIVEAQLRFVPFVRSSRMRVLPSELQFEADVASPIDALATARSPRAPGLSIALTY